MKDTVKVDTRFEQPETNDLLLLCSDGLCGPVADPQILDIAHSTADLAEIAQRLIGAANDRGGPDNITCVVARWVQ
jgi:protein phosphatase